MSELKENELDYVNRRNYFNINFKPNFLQIEPDNQRCKICGDKGHYICFNKLNFNKRVNGIKRQTRNSKYYIFLVSLISLVTAYILLSLHTSKDKSKPININPEIPQETSNSLEVILADILGKRISKEMISKIKDIQTKDLKLDLSGKLNSNSFDRISKSLSVYKRLEKLNLIMRNCDLSTSNFSIFLEFLSKQENLKVIILDFRASRIKDIGELLNTLMNLNLKKININLSNNVINKIEPVYDIHKTSRLESLIVNLRGNNLNELSIQHFLGYLMQLKLLKKLNINLDENPLNQSHIYSLSQYFSSTSNIKQLFLSMSHTFITESSFKRFKLPLNLIKLDLNLGQSYLTRKDIYWVSKALNNLRHLKSLNLNLIDNKIDKVNGLIESIKSKLNLENLRINLRNNPIITKKPLETFMNNYKKIFNKRKGDFIVEFD